MTLSEELKNLFTDDSKNSEMMHEYCCYDEELYQMGVNFIAVESYGGEEQGSDFYTVWRFSKDYEIAFFKFEGWYQSYNGAEFERVYEVTPKEKMVVVYDKVG